MSPADGGAGRVHVFRIDHAYLFKRYFGENALFEALSGYYDDQEYRFEVPEREWGEVAAALREHGYEPEVVEAVADFVVVKEQYTSHAAILQNSVEHWTRRGYTFFLMKDAVSVERAVREHGATPATETDLAVGV